MSADVIVHEVGDAPARLSRRRRTMIAALAVATGAGVLLPDGPWVGGAVAAQVLVAALAARLSGALIRIAGTAAVLLAVPPLVLLASPLGPSIAARVAAGLCGAWILALLDRGPPLSEVPLGRPRWAIGLALLGALLIANSYLLWGPHGAISLMEHEHVRHAGALGAALATGSDVSDWAAQSASGIRATPSALPMAYSVWITRTLPVTPESGELDLVTLTVAVSLASVILAWICLVAAGGIAVRTLSSRRAPLWAAAGQVAVLVGPFAWLRVYGRWPEVVAVGYLLMAAAVLGNDRDASSNVASAGGSRRSNLVAGPALVMACLSWPFIVLPVGLYLLASWVSNRGIVARGRPRGLAIVLVLPMIAGLWWIARTLPRTTELRTDDAGFGGPDWRLLALATLVAIALARARGRGRPERLGAASVAVFLVVAATVVSGLVVDYAASLVAGWSTEAAGLMGILALAAGLPTLVAWLATGDPVGMPWQMRSWRTVATLTLLCCLPVWIPWGGSDWGARTTGILEAIPAWSRSAVGTEALTGRRAGSDARILRCGWDGVIRSPAESGRVGSLLATSTWAAVLAGRTDEVGWTALRYVYPQYRSEATADDQFTWIRTAGPSDVPVRLLWVLPDDVALSQAARIPSEGVPRNVTLRAVGAARFAQELADCTLDGRVA